jgi:hypothetical protein
MSYGSSLTVTERAIEVKIISVGLIIDKSSLISIGFSLNRRNLLRTCLSDNLETDVCTRSCPIHCNVTGAAKLL